MSIATIAIGTNSYTSYATVAEADAYLAADPVAAAAWAALSADDKARRLIDATRRLNLLPWAGERTTATQAGEWPRTGLFHDDGTPVQADTIPTQLKTATILLAGMAGDPPAAVSAVAADDVGEIESELIGPKQVSYWHRRWGRIERLIGTNPAVLASIRRWLRSGTPPAGAFVSGGTTKSAFAPEDRDGRTEGFA